MTGSAVVLWVDRRTDQERQADKERAQAEEQFDSDLKVADLMERAYELHLAGVGYRAIAEEIGVSRMTAYRMVQRHIRMHAPTADAGTYAAQQLAEIALVRKKVIAEALTAPREDRQFHVTALVLIRLQEREDKLTRREQRQVSVDEFELMSDEELAEYANG